ncbi:response regulator [Pseudonocardia spinosispora]|uniref:response regulator n=1 Tax=Pseudonocardia spinosispora TaxID=103441 RepID=UPI00146FB6B9|nr:response regulator [Pseudonocardia spinosispora]
MPPRVAVIDDDEGFRRVAVLLLTTRGYQVVGEAADERSGARLVERTRPDAVLVDRHLPDEDGASLCRRLAPLPRPPRVLMTSSDSEPGSDALYPLVPKECLADIDLGVYLGTVHGTHNGLDTWFVPPCRTR